MVDTQLAGTLRKPEPLILKSWHVLGRIVPFALYLVAAAVHLRQRAPLRRLRERAGIPTRRPGAAPLVWFHAASLGEVAQLRSVVPALVTRFGVQVLVTTTTRTGAEWAAANLPGAMHQYTPVDTYGAWRRFLRAWAPTAAVILESDLWPEMLRQARRKDVPLILLNARHSRTRTRFPQYAGFLLSYFTRIVCRSQAVADEVLATGVARDSVSITSDLKAALPRLPVDAAEIERLSKAIGKRDLWLAASTHEADEETVLKAQARVQARRGALLVWAPRHLRRAGDIRQAAERNGLNVAQRSRGELPSGETSIYLADTMGELGTLYSLSSITYLGGAIGEEGGHNPYEPALFGQAILSGPKTHNFTEAFEALRNAGAVRHVEGEAALADGVLALMEDDDATQMGQRAESFMSAMRDPTEDVLDIIDELLRKDVEMHRSAPHA